MGSGSLRELLVLEKIAFGGVYVTDPVVPTFWGPQLTPRGPRMRNGRQHEQNAGPCTLSRQLFALTHTCVLMIGGGDLDRGLWLAA